MQQPTNPDTDRVLSRFLTDDGRLGEVNEVLIGFHEDYAALRRYLVDEQFLTRVANVYWRSGGSIEA